MPVVRENTWVINKNEMWEFYLGNESDISVSDESHAYSVKVFRIFHKGVEPKTFGLMTLFSVWMLYHGAT